MQTIVVLAAPMIGEGPMVKGLRGMKTVARPVRHKWATKPDEEARVVIELAGMMLNMGR